MGGMRAFPALLLLAALAAGSLPARADPGSLAIEEARVSFREEGAEGTLRLRGDLVATAALAAWDPDPAGVSASLGPAVLAGGAEPEARSRVSRSRNGSWSVVTRRAFGGRGTFSLHILPASGRFEIRARGFPAADLAAAGAGGVTLSLVLGGSSWSGTIDFEPTRRGGWSYSFAPPPWSPPPGDTGGGGPPPGGNASFQTVDRGAVSGIRAFRFAVVSDAASWQALWAEHAPAGGTAPSVDFSREIVIGAFLGPRPSTGYGFEVLSLSSAQVYGAPTAYNGLTATLLESQPGYNCVTQPFFTYPYHIVRTAKPAGGVIHSLVTLADGCY